MMRRTVPVQDLPYGDGLSPEDGIRSGVILPLWRRDRSLAGTEGY